MSTSFEQSLDALSETELFEYPQIGGATVSAPIPAMSNRSGGAALASGDTSARSQQAHSEGVRAGEQQARTEYEKKLATERAKIAEAIEDFRTECRNYYTRVEAEVVHLALAIAGKILHREAQVDHLLLAGLVRVAIDKLQHNTKTAVRVHPSEVDKWREYFSHVTTKTGEVEIVGDPSLESDACVLETSLGEAELGLNAQLKEIERGFFDLLAQRPKT